MDATAAVDGYLAGLEAATRRVADGEWGLTLEAGGWRLDVGLRLHAGLLRAQACVLPAAAVDPAVALHWNRNRPLARFSATRAGELHVEADLPEGALDDETLDRLLGALVEAAETARAAAGDADAAE